MVIHGIIKINKELVFMAGDGYQLVQELMKNPIEIFWLIVAFIVLLFILLNLNKWEAKRRNKRWKM